MGKVKYWTLLADKTRGHKQRLGFCPVDSDTVLLGNSSRVCAMKVIQQKTEYRKYTHSHGDYGQILYPYLLTHDYLKGN